MITLVMGPMFSGKTTEVLRQLERAYLGKKKVALLRPLSDSRPFLSHSGIKFPWLEEIFVGDLNDNFEHVGLFDVIGVDEGQFHSSLTSFCVDASLYGKNVIVSALHATSESEMFENIIELVPHCDRIIKLNAVCTECGSDNGAYTYHTQGSKVKKVEVGGTDKYTALCRKCYYDKYSC